MNIAEKCDTIENENPNNRRNPLVANNVNVKKLEADLKYQEGFLQSVMKKLSNEKFVNNAPAAVLDLERKKQADAESIIASLKESIAALRKQ